MEQLLKPNILSPIISRNQANDPTISHFTLNSINKGNFNYFLNLIIFQPNNTPSKEIPFIEEVVKILGNTSLILRHTENMVERTEDNIFDQLQDHLQNPIINAKFNSRK
ncbi:hypothetical protein M9Y10_020795 [Tritrichomonas musculus]|uniref:Uncharacterized protein n=1 Tax=Tritrichomonas musculus TaxID=1915356 RepID=A0ABR2HEK7_9EUKA